MSRAFVKEDDSELPGDDLPERPQSPHPNYVTSHGLKALQRRVDKLQEERRALTDGGEPEMLDKEHLKLVERDLRYWQERLGKAGHIYPPTQPHDKGPLSATVANRDDDRGERTLHPGVAAETPPQ